MNYKDYYRVLGVERGASEQNIKQAYRRLARQYHPDVNPDKDAEERFKEINEAYTVLSDPEKRRRYDELGVSYYSWQRSSTQNSGFDWSRWTQQDSRRTRVSEERGGAFSDFFNAIFGDGGRRTTQTVNKPPINGTDVEVDVAVALDDAFNGTNRPIKRGNRSFNAHIPPGVQTGTRIRFAEQGEPGFAGGRPGDLYVTVTVTDHPEFERRGDDLHTEIQVPLYSAVLGGEVRIKTLNGDVRLKVPGGTQSGQTIRLKGRGMPKLREETERGDLFARVLIQIPENLSDEEYSLFEHLASLRGI